jgi:hypothetical protein
MSKHFQTGLTTAIVFAASSLAALALGGGRLVATQTRGTLYDRWLNPVSYFVPSSFLAAFFLAAFFLVQRASITFFIRAFRSSGDTCDHRSRAS